MDRDRLPVVDIYSLVAAAGGRVALGKRIGMSPGTIASWTTRGAIPKDYWAIVAFGAAANGRPDITLKTLEYLHDTRGKVGLKLSADIERQICRAVDALVTRQLSEVRDRIIALGIAEAERIEKRAARELRKTVGKTSPEENQRLVPRYDPDEDEQAAS